MHSIPLLTSPLTGKELSIWTPCRHTSTSSRAGMGRLVPAPHGGECGNVPRSCLRDLSASGEQYHQQQPRLRSFQIAREDAARIGQVAPSAAAAVDRLHPARRAARGDQNGNRLRGRERAPVRSRRAGPLPRPKPSITSPAMPRSIVASRPRKIAAERQSEQLYALLESLDLERSAQHRPPMDHDRVAVDLAERTMLV